MKRKEKFPLEVGQKVYLERTGNAGFRENNLRETEIEKIARKYFYVKLGYWGNLRFDLETYEYSPRSSEDCNSGYNLYKSREAYNAHEMELQKKEKKICYVFQNSLRFSEELIETVYAALIKTGIIKEAKE